jgi:hypothetical protein
VLASHNIQYLRVVDTCADDVTAPRQLRQIVGNRGTEFPLGGKGFG